MSQTCPLCGCSWWKYDTSLWRKNTPGSSWDDIGGGQALCNKCVNNRQDEITKHNRLAHRQPGDKKDPNCQHSWAHAYSSRWVCTKCGAEFNMMCGCGGSGYVCGVHYSEFVERAISECGSVEEYISKYCW